MTQHRNAEPMRALSARTREIEADEREAASALIVGVCRAHGLAYCDATPRCDGPLVPGQGFAMYCGGPGRPAVRCTTTQAFAEAQRCRSVPYSHVDEDSTRTTRSGA